MHKLRLISFLLTLLTGSSFAQCGINELEVRVDISTDNWGEETYWTLTDLTQRFSNWGRMGCAIHQKGNP